MTDKNNGGIWIKASDELPKKSKTVFAIYENSMGNHFVSTYWNGRCFILIGIIGCETNRDSITWLRPSQVVEKADADVLVRALEDITVRYSGRGDMAIKFAAEALNTYKQKYK